MIELQHDNPENYNRFRGSPDSARAHGNGKLVLVGVIIQYEQNYFAHIHSLSWHPCIRVPFVSYH